MLNTPRRALFILAVLPFLGFQLTDVEAGTISVYWENVGSDLKASWIGTFDISGYSFGGNVDGNGSANSAGSASFPGFFMYSSVPGTDTLTNYNISSGSAAGADNFDFNIGNSFTFSGTSFALSTNPVSASFDVENSWQNNGLITGTATWSGTNLSTVFGANLPLFASKTMFNDGTNTMTFQAVPEPSTVIGLIAAVPFGLRLLRKRRRTASPATDADTGILKY